MMPNNAPRRTPIAVPVRSPISLPVFFLFGLFLWLAGSFLASCMGQETQAQRPSANVPASAPIYEIVGAVNSVDRDSFVLEGKTIFVTGEVPAEITPGAVVFVRSADFAGQLFLQDYQILEAVDSATP